MKSYEAMSREWSRIVSRGWDDRATLTMTEYANGAIAALRWAYGERANRPSTALRLDNQERRPLHAPEPTSHREALRDNPTLTNVSAGF